LIYILILLLGISFHSFSKGLEYKACYRGYYFFIPVIENCIQYSENGNDALFKTTVKTIGVLRLLKNVEYRGFSVMKSQRSEKFEFYQKEKNLEVVYRYVFHKGFVETEKRKKNRNKVFIDKKRIYLDEKYQDVFTASVSMFKNFKNKKKGKMFIFYDGKTYTIPYYLKDEDRIKVGKVEYNSYRVILKPNIRGEGLLKTRGKWIVWIDKRTGFPIKVKAVFDKGIIYLKRTSFSYKEF